MDTQNEKLQHTFDEETEMTKPISNDDCNEDTEPLTFNSEESADAEQKDAPAEAEKTGEGKQRAKLAAGIGAAAALGGGVGYAASEAFRKGDAEPEDTDDKLEEENELEGDAELTDDAAPVAPAHDAEPVEHVAEKPAGNALRATPTPHSLHPADHAHGETQTPESTFDMVGVNSVTDSDGSEVQIVDAVVNGHKATFVADEDGKVLVGVIDANDDGEIDESEILDLEEMNVTVNDLAELDNVGEKPDSNVLYANNQRTETDQPRPAAEEGTFDVTGIEEVDNDGTPMIEVTANANGHQAAFLADAEGNLVIGAVDVNDNGQIDENEVIDFSDSGATVDNLFALDNVSDTPANIDVEGLNPVILIDEPVQDEVDPAEVRVLGVASDVAIDGELVDVAFAEIDDVPVIIVDADQNGIADVLIADVNGDDEVGEDELLDISGEGIAMPTDPALDGNYAVSDMDDYNNNADTGYFDV